MTLRLVSLSLALLVAPLQAQTPAPSAAPLPTQFAWQWPLDVGQTEGAVRVALTPEVYAQLSQADLSDLVAFNGSDESVPLGPAEQAFDRLVLPPEPAPVAVPLFRIPRATAGAASGDAVTLHIARAADGTLTRLDANVTPGDDRSGDFDLLLDLSAIDAPVQRLLPEIAPEAAGSLNARVELSASSDLVSWQVLGAPLALVSLQEGSFRLQRLALDFAAVTHPYLRLRRIDSGEALPVIGVRAVALRRGEGLSLLPEREAFSLSGAALPDAPGSFEYRSAGPYPVERIAVVLAERNAVANVLIESRDSDASPWRERARTTAFRLGAENDTLDAAPIELAPVRDRHWRLRTEPAQARAPMLTLSYRPEQFVLLTQGPAPYRLAAGSASARRPAYPMRTVLSELRRAHGDLWLPPQARLGSGSALAGDAALSAPPAPPPYKQWLLWGILVGGAIGVLMMVLRLLLAPRTPE